jgi:uncharacterized protein (DUF2252 family)
MLMVVAVGVNGGCDRDAAGGADAPPATRAVAAASGVAVVAAPAGGLEAGRAFDVLQANYGPYCVPGDDLSFPLKVLSLSADQHAFWRGSRDLFFTWAAEHARDWLADPGAYVLNHGDLHLGNIGSYAKEGQLGDKAFGPVDFDDTARLPFQSELLQGMIALRLVARENQIDLGRRREALARAMFDAYRTAVASDKTTLELVSDERRVGKFIDAAVTESYDKTLKKFTDGRGRFLPYVTTKKDKAVKEILRPARERTDDMAAGLAQAIQNSAGARAAFRYHDVATVRRSIKDVCRRTRVESVGSQGLRKYLVLLERPLRGLEMDVVMYVKQEPPAAAERAGAIPRDPRSPGRRCSEDMDQLTNPTAYLNSWCDIGSESYWVTFKEPWSEELEAEAVRDYEQLLEASRVWGSVAGAMHRSQGPAVRAAILERLDRPGLFDQLRHRSTLYAAELDRQYQEFRGDPRAKAEGAKAQAVIDAAKAEAARAGAKEEG